MQIDSSLLVFFFSETPSYFFSNPDRFIVNYFIHFLALDFRVHGYDKYNNACVLLVSRLK